MCSPPGPLNPFPFLDLSVSSVDISGIMLLSITFSAARESTYNGASLPRPLSCSSVSWDQMSQSSRHLLVLVIFSKGSDMLVLGPLVFPPYGDSVPSGPAPLSPRHQVPPSSGLLLSFPPSGSLSHDEPWSSSSSMPLVPLGFTVHSDMPLLPAIVALSGFPLAFAYAFAYAFVFAFVSSASFVPVTRPSLVCCPLGALLTSFLTCLVHVRRVVTLVLLRL